MKTCLAAVLILALCATTARAQYSSAKRMARDAENKINERHRGAEEGAPPPGLPPRGAAAPQTAPAGQPPAQTPPAVAPPVKPASQQVAAAKLKADITEAHGKGEASTELKKQFVADLAAAVQGRSRPSPAALEKFGSGLLPALAAKNVSLAGMDKMIKAIIVSLNSAGLSPARLQELNNEVQAVLTQAGVPAADINSAAQNLAAVVSEIQGGVGK